MRSCDCHKVWTTLTSNVIMTSPQIDIDGVQDTEKRETPSDRVDDDGLSVVGELIDNRSQEKYVNDGPV
jgi:hypothetical protein